MERATFKYKSIAERAIKPFVIGRKGAKASATIYSIIETAKSYKLLVEKYLVYLIEVLSNEDSLTEEKLLEAMPWSKSLPEYLKIPKK